MGALLHSRLDLLGKNPGVVSWEVNQDKDSDLIMELSESKAEALVVRRSMFLNIVILLKMAFYHNYISFVDTEYKTILKIRIPIVPRTKAKLLTNTPTKKL
jgi:hypothetical protein